MLFKKGPEGWGGLPVVSFHALIPKQDEPPFMGVLKVQPEPDLYTVVLVGAEDGAGAGWRLVGKAQSGLGWSQSEMAMQDYMQRNPW